ncbi:hypothetical protein F5Y15DRAFT_397634 [Xylariaceae sp. FL0016]|nr:hypothetical protein F5Y15DRAFT_397634 [Xylariaceae sp. FL0016]
MSSNQPSRPSSNPSPYSTADEIIRSILDDNTSAPADISPSGELFRAIERFHGHSLSRTTTAAQRDSTRNHVNRTAPRSSLRNTMSSERNSEAPRRPARDPSVTDTSPLYNLPPSAPSLPPLRSVSTRRPWSTSASNISNTRHPRSRLSDRYSTRLRSGAESRPELVDDDAFWSLGWASEQGSRDSARRSTTAQTSHSQSFLENTEDDTHSQIQALLDFTHTSSHPYSEVSFPSPPLHMQEPGEESRRAKRRKLDSDRLSSGFQGFRYGKFGQVEPGQLTMELVSCDGGIYSDDGQKYAAENILKNDQTVYCTESPRCNIVLRHQGATVFTLKELVIKAPRVHFSSPVQEGMVFVSMTSDQLLARTAQYQIQYSNTRGSSSRLAGRDTRPLAPVMSITHHEDGSMTRAQVRARRLYNIGLEDEDNNDGIRAAQIPPEFTVSPPPFNVTAEWSDDDGEEANARENWRAPNRIGSLPFESESSDDAGPDDFSHSGTDYNRPRRRRYPSSRALAEAAEAAQFATQEAVHAVGGEMLTPHARFFIEQNKSKCTIKFDPPVSGRFILLKMWSPNRDPGSNIDIQAVVAKGFAGPRYFPSVDLR